MEKILYQARGDDGTEKFTSAYPLDTIEEVKRQIENQDWNSFSSNIVITEGKRNGTKKLFSEKIIQVIKGNPVVFKNSLN